MNANDAFKIFDKDGSEQEFEDMLESALENEIILFGEQHNNPIAHYFQIELLKAIYSKDSILSIGLGSLQPAHPRGGLPPLSHDRAIGELPPFQRTGGIRSRAGAFCRIRLGSPGIAQPHGCEVPGRRSEVAEGGCGGIGLHPGIAARAEWSQPE